VNVKKSASLFFYKIKNLIKENIFLK